MPRRTKGEGSIRTRKDGTKEARFWYMNLEDEWVSKSIYGKTNTIVKAKKESFLAELEIERNKPEEEEVEVPELYGDYLNEWVGSNDEWARGTIRCYEQDIRLYIRPVVGHIPIKELSGPDITKIYKRMRGKGLSRATQARVRSALSKSLKDAIIEERLDTNPMDKVAKHPTRLKTIVDPLLPDEVKTILTCEKNLEYKAIWTTFLHTGLRRGELVGLQWKDIDFDRTVMEDGVEVPDPQIHLSRQVDKWGNYKLPKGDKTREIFLTPIAKATLLAHRAYQTELRLRTRLWVDNDLVFPNAHGEVRPGDDLYKQFVRRLKALGIRHRTLHDWRATCATMCRAGGVDIMTVSKMLGHANVSMTLNIYSASTPEMDRQGARKLNTVLSKVS